MGSEMCIRDSFVEVEVLVEKQEDVEKARTEIEMIAGELGLQRPESRSYLRMVLEEKPPK